MSLEVISSINKLFLGLFVVVVSFLVYQTMRILKGGSSVQDDKIVMKDYHPEMQDSMYLNATKLPESYLHGIKSGAKKSSNTGLILASWFLLALFGVGFVFTRSKMTALQKTQVQGKLDSFLTDTLHEGSLKIYSSKGESGSAQPITIASQEASIVVGLKLPALEHISKVRFLVNSTETNWDHAIETSNYDKKKGSWITQYTLATQSGTLTVKAQVYHDEKGWLSLTQ